MKAWWNHYHYKNLSIVGLSLLLAMYLLQNQLFHDMLVHLGGWGYLGAFIAGAMFVSTFTVSIGTVVLFILADNHLSALEIGTFAALGAVAADYLIFQSIRSQGVLQEIRTIYFFFGGNKLTRLLHTKYFSWTLPVVGAIIIATPLPDEVGVSLLGISHMRPLHFILLSFVLNFIGIFVVVSAGVLF